jgi:multiple sugar transport system substrate-binding protein
MMRKLIREVIIIALSVTLLAGILSGCAGTKKEGGSAKQETITLYRLNTPDQQNMFPKMGKDFTKLHPNVTVKYIGVPMAEFDSKLMTMCASNTQPDITAQAGVLGQADFFNKGWLIDLTPYIKKYNFDYQKDNLPENVWNNAKINGEQYGIPLELYTTVLVYNKDLFDKAGVAYPTTDYNDTSWTFDKMVDTAKKLTSGSGQKEIYGLNWGWDGGGAMQDPDYFGSSLFQSDAASTGHATSNNLSDPAVYNAYQRIADLTFKDKVMPPIAVLTALSSAGDAFYSGRIAMEVTGTWTLAGVNTLPFKVGVAAVPVGPNPKIRDVLYSDWYYVFKGSKDPDDAFKFLAFMAQPDTQAKLVQESGGDPPASIAALSTYYSNFKSIDSKDLKSVIEGSYPYGEEDLEHYITGSSQIHTLLANELSYVFDGTKTAKSVCVPLQQKLNDTLTTVNKK